MPVSTSERVNANVNQELLRQHVVPGSRGHILMEIHLLADLALAYSATTTQQFLAEF
jgi:hypothetical protein